MEFLSHDNPKKALKKHLLEVAKLSNQMIMETPILEEERCFLSKMAVIIGISHDYGKYTTFFQEYLIDGKTKYNNHQHSFISSFFVAYMIDRLLDEKNLFKDYGPLIGYFVVLHHHGDLKSLRSDVISNINYIDGEELNGNFGERITILKNQIENQKPYQQNIQSEYEEMLSVLGFSNCLNIIADFATEWESFIEKLDELFYKWNRMEKNTELKEKMYFYVLLLYSILIDSDKHSAAGISFSKRKIIPSDLVDLFREGHFDLSITYGTNGWRNRIYQNVIERINNLGDELIEHRLFTLTSPTGSGKTLLSFSVALKMREMMKRKYDKVPRIIYALPFTSIIDQNEKVIRKILSQMPDFEMDESNYLLKHHHLSDIKYREDSQEKPVTNSLLLIESWESEVVVTTFIQLFYTLIGFKNKALKKYHQVAGSIIILDEVQNLPMEYWPLIRQTLRTLTKALNCKIILLTATQPLIFDSNESIELLQDKKTLSPEPYFKELNRVKLFLKNKEGYTIEEWIDMFIGDFEHGKNYLAVFNTIKTSIEVYKQIREWIQDNYDYEVYYLSTNIIPRKRKNRINQIRMDLTKGKKVILISTQVVEAGVDLDFDIVYRDLGPIDSIIQVAGRCNRNGRNPFGYVFITPIRRNKQLESNIIYRQLHTKMALNLLPEKPINENEFYELINNYYNNVLERKNQDDSQYIWDAMNQLLFVDENTTKRSVSDFTLIENKHNYIDVFVETDDYAEVIWSHYKEKVLNNGYYNQRYEAYLKLKKYMQQYIVSAPIHLVMRIRRDDITSNILYLPRDLVNQYYDYDIGIIRSQEDIDAWIM